MAQTIVINGVSYPGTPSIDVLTSNNTSVLYHDTSGANATAADILTGKTAYNAGGEVSGSMPSNGSTSGTISTKSGTVTIPAGYTTGGTVSIAASAVSDLSASTLLAGKNVLGITGTLALPTISQDATTKILSIR